MPPNSKLLNYLTILYFIDTYNNCISPTYSHQFCNYCIIIYLAYSGSFSALCLRFSADFPDRSLSTLSVDKVSVIAAAPISLTSKLKNASYN